VLALVATLSGCALAPAQPDLGPRAYSSATPSPVYTPNLVPFELSPPVAIRIPKLESIWGTATQEVGSFIPSDGVLDPGENEFRPMWFDGPKYGGMPGGADTVYLGGHTSRHGITPSNAFFDRDTQTPNIAVGDKIYVTTANGKEFCYVVDSVVSILKTDLDADTNNRFWQHEPRLLAYVLCQQGRDDIPSVMAMLVFAKQQSSGC